MKYKLISGNTKQIFTSFEKATNKLVKLGQGKLYYGTTLVGEL